MDRMIYTAMTGAKALEQRQHALSNNLANASTDGFRADIETFRAVPVQSPGSATTRVFNVEATAGFDAASGALRQTGSPLDMAIHGEGWFAVQDAEGAERYTRNGAFALGADGQLQTQAGLAVLGDAGPIVVPENAQLMVGDDGTVTAQVGAQAPVAIGRLKLVNPPPAGLEKLGNGLVRLKDDAVAPADEAVRMASGVLEGSNVNVVEAMVGMIAVSRQFEMQMRLMQNAESNEQRATSILSRSG